MIDNNANKIVRCLHCQNESKNQDILFSAEEQFTWENRVDEGDFIFPF